MNTFTVITGSGFPERQTVTQVKFKGSILIFLELSQDPDFRTDRRSHQCSLKAISLKLLDLSQDLYFRTDRRQHQWSFKALLWLLLEVLQDPDFREDKNVFTNSILNTFREISRQTDGLQTSKVLKLYLEYVKSYRFNWNNFVGSLE